jgi:pimeloyl-ACP methyl ester carboxylesterase
MKRVDPSKPDLMLSCLPEVESGFFEMDVSTVYPHLHRLPFSKTAIFEGEDSHYLQAGHLADMATRFKHGEYHLIPGGRHILMCEKPTLMAQHLIRFVADLPNQTQTSKL